MEYEPLNSSKKILENFKSVLVSEKNIDIDAICLYDVLNLLKQKKSEYKKLQENYQNYFENISSWKIAQNRWCHEV